MRVGFGGGKPEKTTSSIHIDANQRRNSVWGESGGELLVFTSASAVRSLLDLKRWQIEFCFISNTNGSQYFSVRHSTSINSIEAKSGQ